MDKLDKIIIKDSFIYRVIQSSIEKDFVVVSREDADMNKERILIRKDILKKFAELV